MPGGQSACSHLEFRRNKFGEAASRIHVFTGDKASLRESVGVSGERMSAMELLRKRARKVDRTRTSERPRTLVETIGKLLQTVWLNMPRLVLGEQFAPHRGGMETGRLFTRRTKNKPTRPSPKGTYYHGLTIIDGDTYRLFMWNDPLGAEGTGREMKMTFRLYDVTIKGSGLLQIIRDAKRHREVGKIRKSLAVIAVHAIKAQ